MIVGIYIRVSSATQVKDGYSLQAQKERLTAYCKAQGWKNYKFYIEKGLSGRDTKRPVYQSLMEDVRQKKVKIVLVYKLDRIMRSIGELDKMLKTFEDHECGFTSATEPFDTTNPTGRLFMYIVAAFAQWEVDVSSERIKMVLEEKVANEGIWIGGVPYPFDKDEETIKLVPNKRRTVVMLKMIDLFKKGLSSIKIAEYLTEHNDDKVEWHHNTVLRLLRNPALCGDTYWSGKVYENTHPGIITRAEFDKLQEMLNHRSTARLRHVESTYVLQGTVACPSCQNVMRVNRYFRKRKDGSAYQGAIYRCPPCAKIGEFKKSPSEHNLLIALYQYMETVKLGNYDNVKTEINAPEEVEQLRIMERRRRKFQKAWASDLITDEEFQELMEETREPYEELKSKVDSYEIPKPINVKDIKSIIFMFNDNFKQLTVIEKREFVSSFIKLISFKVISNPPKDPRNKRGKYTIEVTNVLFY